MERDHRIVVVGAGAAGLSTAWNLVELGCRDVTVLDQHVPISGAPQRSAGVFTRQYLDRLDIELRSYGHERIAALEREGLVTLRRIGYLRLARDAATLARFEAAVVLQRALGVNDATTLARQELASVVPHLHVDDLAGGMWRPSDGYLDGHLLTRVYAEKATARGARLVQRAEVLEAEGGDGEPLELRTTAGTFQADFVVNAAGAWGAEVGRRLHAPLPLAVQREQLCFGRLPEAVDYVLPSVVDAAFGDGEPGLFIRDAGDGQCVVGLHSDAALEPSAAHAQRVDHDFGARCAERLLARFPGLAGIGLREGWAGLYPVSADGQAIVGPNVYRAGVIDAGGLGGVGIMLSPAIGRLAAEWIVFGEPRAVAGADALLQDRFVAPRAAPADAPDRAP